MFFPGRGRKCQLGKIPIEINSNMTVDLGHHGLKMKIGCQIFNNVPNVTMLASECLYLLDLSNAYFRYFTFPISSGIDDQGQRSSQGH